MLDWVLDWFVSNKGIDKEDLKQHLDESFFELGYIDSFGFIMLIGAVNEELGVTFDNEQFQDRSFSTLRGFANALEGRKAS